MKQETVTNSTTAKKRKFILRGDLGLWVVYVFWAILSMLMVYSSVGYTAYMTNKSPVVSFIIHLGFFAFSFFISWLLAKSNYRKVVFPIIVIMLFAWVAQAFLAFSGTRWIRLGPMSIQPSEFLKVCFLIYLARVIAREKEQIEEKKSFWVLLGLTGFAAAPILPMNLSSAALLFLICYIEIGFSNVDRKMWKKGLLIIFVLSMLGFIALYFLSDQVSFMRSSTWGHRLNSWMHPNYEEYSQENMARMAIARGGFWGTGAGTTVMGRLITQADNDFIYAILIEEHGLFFGIATFLLYCIFYYRSIRIARRCQGTFGSVAVAGLSTMIFLQAIMNMAVATGAMPVTGQTLPFISRGGSALWAVGIAFGFIQSVAADNERRAVRGLEGGESGFEEDDVDEVEIETNTNNSEEVER